MRSPHWQALHRLRSNGFRASDAPARRRGVDDLGELASAVTGHDVDLARSALSA
jgi:hypothetical protein